MILVGHFFMAQNVILNKVEKTHSNADKFLYKINPEAVNAEYLGEIEVQGFSDDDVKIFGMIYKKGKGNWCQRIFLPTFRVCRRGNTEI